jgi:hypothetical protein
VQVGQGKVLELSSEATKAIGVAVISQGAEDGAAAARHAAEEARMLQLLAERAAMLERAKVKTSLALTSACHCRPCRLDQDPLHTSASKAVLNMMDVP